MNEVAADGVPAEAEERKLEGDRGEDVEQARARVRIPVAAPG